MTNRVTIADIARAAGVSPSTVSRALNHHTAIPESTRQQIQQIASDLHYRLDVRARNFRLQRSQTVATLFPFQDASRRPLSDPFYLEIVGAITDELDRHGYDSLIARVHVESDDWCSRYVLDKRVDGILLIDRAVEDAGIETLQSLGANFVVWGATVENQDYVTVGCDSRAGARDAVRHLVEIGRRRIAFIGGFGRMVETDARRRGYLQGISESGLPIDDQLICYTDFTPEAAGSAVQNLLECAPDLDGVFACSDFMAVGVMEVLRQRGRRVPEDVAVIGYDDVPLAAYYAPHLTTIHQPIHEGGRQMVQKLLALIDGDEVQSAILPHTLVIRASTSAK
ncbi:MAG: LacI family DNA-binding transcriptional regulator [Chloroflexota bacterium]